MILCGWAIAEEEAVTGHTGTPRIGVLWASASNRYLEGVRVTLEDALREVGYVAGRNVTLEHRFPATPDQLPDLATSLINAKCDVVIAIGTRAALALKQKTTQVPVVFFDVGDPIGTGLVQNLARPGANITGVSALGPELSVKLAELAKEAVPNLSRVAVIWDRANPSNARQVEELMHAAPALKLQVRLVELRDFLNAPAILRKQRAAAVVILRSAASIDNAARISALVTAQRLPMVGAFQEVVEAGGLIAYFPSFREMWMVVARYVSEILRGTAPAMLPVQQSARFELLLNIKAAKALGITIPQSLRVRADRRDPMNAPRSPPPLPFLGGRMLSLEMKRQCSIRAAARQCAEPAAP